MILRLDETGRALQQTPLSFALIARCSRTCELVVPSFLIPWPYIIADENYELIWAFECLASDLKKSWMLVEPKVNRFFVPELL